MSPAAPCTTLPNRAMLLAAPIGLLAFLLTLTLCWPLRHQESIFDALAWLDAPNVTNAIGAMTQEVKP